MIINKMRTKMMPKLLFFLLACMSLLLMSCGKASSKKVDEICARNGGKGELRVGVKIDVPHFGYIDPETDELTGLEIDLAHEFAEKITGNRHAIKFIPTTGMAKETLLANGEADLIIGTYTITEDRKKEVNFSQPYYTDEIGFLVREDSQITSMEDFEHKTIGATRSGTTFSTLDNEKDIIPVAFKLKGFTSYPEIQDALENGKIDIFSADKSILLGYMNDDLVILEDGILPQPYGIGSEISDKEFAQEVDQILSELAASGRLKELVDKWTE